MHDTANHESRDRATGQVEGGAIFHSKVFNKTPLGKEVCGQLDGATKAGTDHSRSDTSVESLDAFAAVYLP